MYQSQHISVSGKFVTFLVILFTLWGFTYLTQSMMKPSHYFTYESIIPVGTHFTIGEPLLFTSNVERYRVTNMHYEDTLRCGFTPNELFWYSQMEGDYAEAPIGKKSNQWRYSGEIPTVPMFCQLRSLPSANLPFGLNSNPQVIEGPFFYLTYPEEEPPEIIEPPVEPVIPKIIPKKKSIPPKIIPNKKSVIPIPKPIPKPIKLTPPSIQSVLDSHK